MFMPVIGHFLLFGEIDMIRAAANFRLLTILIIYAYIILLFKSCRFLHRCQYSAKIFVEFLFHIFYNVNMVYI